MSSVELYQPPRARALLNRRRRHVSWVVQGPMIRGVIVRDTRIQAERAAEEELADVWTLPCTMTCGSTEGVEVVRRADRTAYVWGDGYVAEVVRGR